MTTPAADQSKTGKLVLKVKVGDHEYGVWYQEFAVPYGSGGLVQPTLEDAFESLRASVIRSLVTQALGDSVKRWEPF